MYGNICEWALNSEIERKYHNEEWCKIKKNDRDIFEFLVLEFMQAGLSWKIILNKREDMRAAFDNFDYLKISKYDDKKIDELMKNNKIIRNRLKLKALVNNAKEFIKIQEEYGSFYNFIWKYTDFKIINNNSNYIATKSELSKKISLDLKKRSFKFLGETVVYSFLQAIGIINDHINTCDFK